MKKLKFILQVVLVLCFFMVTACSEIGSFTESQNNSEQNSNGGGNMLPEVSPDIPPDVSPDTPKDVTPIDFPDKPFSILGVYKVENYSINGKTQTAEQGSEFRVNISLEKVAEGEILVLLRLSLNGKTTKDMVKVIKLGAISDLNKFISDTFTNLGAEVTGKYGLKFTLKSEEYSEAVEAGIIKNGETLVLNMVKIKDLKEDTGLDSDKPVKPESIPVTDLIINTPERVYFKGSDVNIDFELQPLLTTDSQVTYSIDGGNSLTISTVDGKGAINIKDVQENIVITIITAKGHKKTYTIQVSDKITEISFDQKRYTLDKDAKAVYTVNNFDTIKNMFEQISYTSQNSSIAQVDSNTGEVTGIKNGVTTITVSMTPVGQKIPLTASYEIDVLSGVDFSTPKTLSETMAGTYEITFFGTSPGTATGGSGGLCWLVRPNTNVPVTNNCETFEALFGKGTCVGTTFADKIMIENKDLAGRMVIQVDETGSARIATKLLMTAKDLRTNSANDQYQYTIYKPTSAGQPDNSGYTVKDVKGRNLVENNGYVGSDFKIEKYDNQNNSKTIQLFSQLKDKKISAGGCNNMSLNPRTYIVATKISSESSVMDYSSVTNEPFNKVLGVSPEVADLGNTPPSFDLFN